MKQRTAGGYTVEKITVTTASRLGDLRSDSWRVTDPHGYDVPLDPWDPQHSPPIRTDGQLAAVLAREGQS